MSRAYDDVATSSLNQTRYLREQFPCAVDQFAANRAVSPRLERGPRFQLKSSQTRSKEAVGGNECIQRHVNFGINASIRYGQPVRNRHYCRTEFGVG